MGDKIKMDAGATLQVLAPARANIRLIRHGEIVAQVENETTLTHMPLEPAPTASNVPSPIWVRIGAGYLAIQYT